MVSWPSPDDAYPKRAFARLLEAEMVQRANWRHQWCLELKFLTDRYENLFDRQHPEAKAYCQHLCSQTLGLPGRHWKELAYSAIMQASRLN